MAKVVALPEPRPDDDEDVVWGLSTATALWGRGERYDAIVWVRRAAEAATAAGQPFRASELGLFANELEEAMVNAARVKSSRPAPLPTPPPPPPRPPMPAIGLEVDENEGDTLAED